MATRKGFKLMLTLLLTLVLVSASVISVSAEGGKHINAALYWFGTSLDPAVEWDGWTTCRAGITETLVTVNENYEIVPLLADSWEQTDDTTWNMHIREGVTFHNGKPVDGEAVKKSFERAFATQERAVTAAKIESIEADGQNVIFKTTEPFGAFLANISEPMYSIVDADADTDFASAPEMDIVQRVAWTDIPVFEADDQFVVYNTQGARTRILVFNYRNEMLQDLNVRKAIIASIDYDALAGVLGSGVSKAGAPYPASAPYGYDELEKQEYDPEAAAALLAEAGYEDADGNGYVEKDGQELAFTITYENTGYTTMLEAVQDMAKQCGIHFELQQVDSISDFKDNGNYDIVATNWQVLSTGDPQWFLDSMYKTGSSSNFAQYSNEELDAVIEKLAQTFDIEGREALTIEAEKILLADAASIYLVGENNFVVANAKVQNVVPYPIDYYFIDNGLSIE